jgi:UV DNA damage endonuclease
VATHRTRRGPRLGLCCTFSRAPIKFRAATARYVSGLGRAERVRYLSDIALDNATALVQAVDWCAEHGVGAFRVTSQLFPLLTHPTVGYEWRELPSGSAVAAKLAEVRARSSAADVRLSFHPDQFVVPGSPTPATVAASLRELAYQGDVAELIGAEQLTLHGGGAQGGKGTALARLERGLDRLTPAARARVVLENDDRVYTVRDLLPLCRSAGVPLVYDVHHHRCNPDDLSIDDATAAAIESWGGREPWFHVSSPAEGWGSSDPRPHHDRVQLRDVPAAWRDLDVTIDVEAKGKEPSVLALARAIRRG